MPTHIETFLSFWRPQSEGNTHLTPYLRNTFLNKVIWNALCIYLADLTVKSRKKDIHNSRQLPYFTLEKNLLFANAGPWSSRLIKGIYLISVLFLQNNQNWVCNGWDCSAFINIALSKNYFKSLFPDDLKIYSSKLIFKNTIQKEEKEKKGWKKGLIKEHWERFS